MFAVETLRTMVSIPIPGNKGSTMPAAKILNAPSKIPRWFIHTFSILFLTQNFIDHFLILTIVFAMSGIVAFLGAIATVILFMKRCQKW